MNHWLDGAVTELETLPPDRTVLRLFAGPGETLIVAVAPRGETRGPKAVAAVAMRDILGQKDICTLDPKNASPGCSAVDCDGRYLAALGEDGLEIRERGTGRCLATFNTSLSAAERASMGAAVAFSPTTHAVAFPRDREHLAVALLGRTCNSTTPCPDSGRWGRRCAGPRTASSRWATSSPRRAARWGP